ncbi:hypothetical protein AAVH_29294 [Aphelenchoides avenae]|nr:hypothetical protein AAVH_29294 [Aphelenchus avenae]
MGSFLLYIAAASALVINVHYAEEQTTISTPLADLGVDEAKFGGFERLKGFFHSHDSSGHGNHHPTTFAPPGPSFSSHASSYECNSANAAVRDLSYTVSRLQNRIDSLEKRLDTMHSRLSSANDRLDRLAEKLRTADARFDIVERRFDEFDDALVQVHNITA